MVLNTTFYKKEHKRIIDDLVGKPYTFWEIIKKRGIGSKKMLVESVSPNFDYLTSKTSVTNYVNIELRPNGILVFFIKGLENFTWIIPYYQLYIYKTNTLSIHAQGSFVKFLNNYLLKNNDQFIKKIIQEKVIFDQQYELPAFG
jgi:hypothetical protein